MADEAVAVGKPYSGPSSAGRSSQWLTWEDLLGKDGKPREITIAIAAVELFSDVKFEGGRTKDQILGVKFAKARRILLLNSTNRKRLNAMFGILVEGWVGKTVTLHVSEAKLSGKTVNCVRIREQQSQTSKSAAEFLDGGGAVAAKPEGNATPAGPSPSPSSDAGKPDPEKVVAFERGCSILNLSDEEAGEILDRHEGDYDAANRELTELNKKAADGLKAEFGGAAA